MRRALLALSVLAATSCGDGVGPMEFLETPPPFLEGDASNLEFTASISKTKLSVGETATLTFVLRNPTSARARLTFTSTCQIVPNVKRGGQRVYPGPLVCGHAITNLTLEAGEERRVPLDIRATLDGSERVLGGLSLTPGSYVSYAELNNGDGRSTSVRFTIKR